MTPERLIGCESTITIVLLLAMMRISAYSTAQPFSNGRRDAVLEFSRTPQRLLPISPHFRNPLGAGWSMTHCLMAYAARSVIRIVVVNQRNPLPILKPHCH